MSLFAVFYMIFAYLLGSVSSAILICKMAGLPDPRQNGSHNPGATNVLRLGGRWAALGVLVFDILKGMLPVWAGYYLGLSQFELGMVALGACLGHIFPIFFQFKGGKGVATALGVLLALSPATALICALIWLVMAFGFKVSSLAALVATVCAPIFAFFMMPHASWAWATVFIAALVLYRHKSNIQNLLQGKESKIGDKAGKS